MQLNKIKTRMSLATCALLQVTGATAQTIESEWEVESAVLLYSESDNRVTALEPAVYATREISDDEKISLRLVVDSLTGASPNGAHASTVAQTFTTPSGKRSYTTGAGETPLDDTFLDTRVAFGADWEIGLDRVSRITWGGNVSKEFDYTSLGLSATYARDLNDRNTTLTAGMAFNNDLIDAVGGMPSPLQPMVDVGSSLNREGSDDDKTITDFLFGVTQVISRQTIIQLNFSLGQTDGYQNDPYKIVSVIDPGTGLPATTGSGSFFDTPVTGNLPYLYESRPETRDRNVLYFKAVHHFEEDVINFSYRYYDDDWDVTSHTFDLRYRYEMDKGYLQPHIRFYQQDAANFYVHNLQLGTDVNATTGVASAAYASNDYRLAESETVTLGLKYGLPLGNNSEFSMRAEVISQTVNDGLVPVGEQTPDLDALVFQVNYSLLW
jgi:hypothetical protein